MAGTINGFDYTLDQIQSAGTTTEPVAALKQIRKTRQDILILRRCMAPQRDGVSMLHADPPKWFAEGNR